jgi:hypothetical protein
MRRVPAMLSVVAVVLMAGGLVAQTKPSFAGEWKMVADPDSSDGRGSSSGADLTITQNATTMTLEYRGAPVKVTYKLDGSESKNMIAGRAGGAPTEQVSKTAWAGNRLVVTTTTAAGEERRTFTTDGGYLVVETSAPARDGKPATVGKVTYKKYERGYGG